MPSGSALRTNGLHVVLCSCMKGLAVGSVFGRVLLLCLFVFVVEVVSFADFLFSPAAILKCRTGVINYIRTSWPSGSRASLLFILPIIIFSSMRETQDFYFHFARNSLREANVETPELWCNSSLALRVTVTLHRVPPALSCLLRRCWCNVRAVYLEYCRRRTSIYKPTLIDSWSTSHNVRSGNCNSLLRVVPSRGH